jgi:hypothetical protein
VKALGRVIASLWILSQLFVIAMATLEPYDFVTRTVLFTEAGVTMILMVKVWQYSEAISVLNNLVVEQQSSNGILRQSNASLRTSNHGLRMQNTELTRMVEFHREMLAMRVRVHFNGIVIHEHNIRTAYGIARGRDGRARYTFPEGAIIDYVTLPPTLDNPDAQEPAEPARTPDAAPTMPDHQYLD